MSTTEQTLAATTAGERMTEPLTVHLRDATLQGDRYGTGEVDALLLHGLACDRQFWKPCLELLAQSGALSSFRLFSLDARFHGASSARPGRYAPENFAADFVAAASACCRPPVIWIGHSMGGMVGLQAAVDHEPSLAGLILVDAVPSLEAGKALTSRRNGARLHGPTLDAIVRRRQRIRTAMPEGAYDAIWRQLIAMDLRDRLGGITVPVYWIVADRGAWTTADLPYLLRATGYDAVPCLRAELIRDSDHYVMIEQLAALTATLQRALAWVECRLSDGRGDRGTA